jgi:hypothetical protein
MTPHILAQNLLPLLHRFYLFTFCFLFTLHLSDFFLKIFHLFFSTCFYIPCGGGAMGEDGPEVDAEGLPVTLHPGGRVHRVPKQAVPAV